MADAMRTLPDAELEVMQAIWACEEPVKRAAISAILDRTHPMAPTTLLTVLSRLADKGASGLTAEELAQLRELLREDAL